MSIKPEKEDKVEDTFVWICLIDPGQYRVLDELVRNETNGDGVMELVDLKGVAEESEDQALKG